MRNILIILVVMLSLLASAALANITELPETAEFPETGFSFIIPENVKAAKGQISMPSDRGEVPDFGTGIVNGFLVYTARTDEEAEAFNEQRKILEEQDDFDAYIATVDKYFEGWNFQIFEVYGLRDGVTRQDAIDQVCKGIDPYKDWIELGKMDDYTYWLATYNFDHPYISEYLSQWPQEMADELRQLVDDIAVHPEAFTLRERVVAFQPPEIGSVMAFETTDINGNPVSSKDLFAGKSVTLINIWRTWCEPCLGEMPELNQINQEYAEKGAQVITYCADADSEELRALAADLMKDYGFISLAYSESIDKAIPWKVTPLSYFVDSEGKVLGYPVVGSDIDEYISRLDAYLMGETVETKESVPAEPETVATYIIKVVDQNGDPVPKVTMNFCTATTCTVNRTDGNGVITFEGEPYAYHVSILKVPAGYTFKKDDTIYTEEKSSSLTLVVTKE